MSKTVTSRYILTGNYLRSRSSQKVVNLFVGIDSTLEIGDSTDLSLNQVVTVDGSGDSSAIHPGRHELQDSHLTERVVPE